MATPLDLEKIVTAGEKLGYKGQELREFLEQERKILTEQRAAEREARANERQSQLTTIEENEKQRQAQLTFIAAEKQRLELEIEADHRRLTMQIELEQIKKQTREMNSSVATGGARAKPPKLPLFNEDRDQLDMYLQRFERYAAAQNWNRDEWALNLSSLLTGKALNVYSSIPIEDAHQYEILKFALLKAYNLTEDGYKQKFRTSKPDNCETAMQFIARLNDYITKWLDSANVDRTYDAVLEFLVKDQFLQVIPSELAIFVKEREPKNANEAARVAERYLTAHGGWQHIPRTQMKSRTPPVPKRVGNSLVGPLRSIMNSKEQKSNPSAPEKSSNDKRTCHFCHKAGHFWRSCPVAPKSFIPSLAMIIDVMREEFTCEDDLTREGEYNESYPSIDPNPHDDQQPSLQDDPCTEINVEDVIEASFLKIDSMNDHHVEQALQKGHFDLRCGHRISLMTAACNAADSNMPVTDGYVGDTKVRVLRDTGCSGAVVKSNLVSDNQLTGQYKSCILIDGTVRRFPVATIRVDTPFYTGKVSALCMKEPVYDLVLGNIDGVRHPSNPDIHWGETQSASNEADPKETSAAVETRSQSKGRPFKLLKVDHPITDIVTPDQLMHEQQEDTTLAKLREFERTHLVKECKDGSSFAFVKKAGILYREFYPKGDANQDVRRQVVVPSKYRKQVMRLAHESLLGGHQGIRKTIDKIRSNFFWPGLQADVRRHCQSCDICQRTSPKGRVTKVPLGTTPLMDAPFDRVAIDLVGPIIPCSDRGHRYILVLVDYATRYPEAVPMKSIEAERVAEELVNMYSRLGFPREVLSDQGSQFTANVMKEVNRLLSIRQMTSTPYNPKCNGLVERFNGTLKSMLKKMCEEKPKDWDRYIGPLLFAYRETPHENTGFAPFELLFGRTVRGPMMILKELWTKEIEQPETKSTYQYVLDLRDRLEETCKLAQQESSKAKQKYTAHYNKRTKPRELDVGDDVLLLLPTDGNKLLMQWRGPFPVVTKKSRMDYTIDLGSRQKTFHINMLKKYNRRVDHSESEVAGSLESSDVLHKSCTSVIEDESDYVPSDPVKIESFRKELIHLPTVEQKETVKDVKINTELSSDQFNRAKRLVSSYADVLTDLPGRTNLGKHDILLLDDKPVRRKPYPIPHSLRQKVQDEIDSMMKMDLVEPSDSPYASPLVIVKKPDGADRYCVDFRLLNAKSRFDAEPIPDQTEIFAKLANDRYFTKLDLSKGYWQIPLAEEARPLTAFITHHGLFHWKVMPFGLVNSGATFSRVMRRLLKGLEGVDNYIDDILIHTPTFEEHVLKLREVFRRLRIARLTAKPSKCFIGYFEVEFLGHVVGKGQTRPRPAKIEAIMNAPRPETKSQLRSYLGLTGYYRSFIPNYASIAVPLTDRTKKGEPNKVRWEENQEVSFQALKDRLVSSPILHLPDLNRPFILRTDASDVGIAAMLMQEHDGERFPVAYASKKLSKCQRNYSVIERECLAIVWAVQRYEPFLYGKEFTIETDHQPLKCVQRSNVANGRIMRWALALQQYRYRIEVIQGSKNVGADFLSRAV